MVRQIPGMYWDNEKKKYFAIQPNHIAPPGAAYTVDKVKQLELEKGNALADAEKIKMTKDLIRRSGALRDPFVGGTLSRELGRRQDEDLCAKTLCQGLEGQEILQSEDIGDDLLLVQIGIPLETASTVHINDFAYDPEMDCLLFPVRKRWIFFTRGKGATRWGIPARDCYFRRQAADYFWSGVGGDVATITFNPHKRLVLATWLMDDQSAQMLAASYTKSSDPNSPEADLRIQNAFGPVFDRKVSVSCATHTNPHSESSFVIGTSEGALVLDRTCSDLSVLHASKLTRDVLAVECFKDNPNLVLTGDRKGLLLFCDVRCRNAVTAVIHHASSIYHIKHIQDVAITVAGLQSTLCNYDSRFLKDRPLAQSWPEFDSRRGQRSFNATTPVLTYPEHENDAWSCAGFAVDTDAGIAAAAQTGPSTSVKIFSLKTGMRLRTLNPTQVGRSADPLLARAIRFVPDPAGSGRNVLWVAKGTKIVSYGW